MHACSLTIMVHEHWIHEIITVYKPGSPTQQANIQICIQTGTSAVGLFCVHAVVTSKPTINSTNAIFVSSDLAEYYDLQHQTLW